MKDPVCKMEVGKKLEFRSSYKSKEYVFCSANCKLNFDKNPEKYVNNATQ